MYKKNTQIPLKCMYTILIIIRRALPAVNIDSLLYTQTKTIILMHLCMGAFIFSQLICSYACMYIYVPLCQVYELTTHTHTVLN